MSKKHQSRLSLRDLAAHAGVSVPTVSRILSRGESDLFTGETVEKVYRAARELGYRPNLLIRGMQTGRTFTIGVMVPGTGPFYPSVIDGIHHELSKNDYVFFLAWNEEDIPPPESEWERQVIHRLIDRRVDGILLRPTHDNVSDLYFSEVSERGIPLVTVDRELSGVHCDFAGTDDLLGGQIAAQHLLSLGHCCLGHLAGPEEVSTARDRRRGFERAVRDSGCGASCVTVVCHGTFRNSREEAFELLRKTPRPTAVFAVSDEAAQNIYDAAAEIGLRIPQDLAVVGFADLPFAQHLNPPLTTLRQDGKLVGKTAAELLLARINQETNANEPRHVRIPPELIVRQSTAPPRAERA